MIPSSYKPIEGESPPQSPSNQSTHQRLLQRIQSIDRSFVVSKLFYFFFYTALGALFPFFSLYYKQIWLSAGQIGILLALRPTVKLVCLPLWKMVTDTYSKPRAVYFISIFGWLIGYYGQTLVSPNDIPCYVNTTGSLSSTKFNQSIPLNASLSIAHDMASSRDWSLIANNLNTIPVYTGKKISYNSAYSKRIFKRDTFSERSNRKKLKLLSRSQSNEQATDEFNTQHQNAKAKQFVHKRLVSPGESTYKSERIFSGGNEISKKQLQGAKLALKTKDQREGTSFDSLREKDNAPIKTDGLGVNMVQYINEVSYDDTRKPYGPSNDNPSKSPKPSEDFRVRYNYWIIRTLAVIIILTEIITTPTPMLADSAVIQSLANTDSDYGKQRLFGTLGLALSAGLVAVWVSYSSFCHYTDTINYIPCFNIFIIAIGATIFVSLFFKFETQEREQEEYKVLEAFKIFKTPRNGFFLFTMFVLGFAHSLQIGFLFWFLQDIGGTPVLFALIILVYCVSEVVMYFIMGPIIKAIGHQRALAIAIACYSARFLMYGSLEHPWLVIPMEAVQGMTYGGVWMVAGMYIKGPEGSKKIIQSILHGAYWGVGMAIGALVSGFVIQVYGAHTQFLVMALVMALLCVAHLFIFLVDRIEDLEESARKRREAPHDLTPTTKKKGEKQENFIGAAAAPLVPCLLYGR